MSKALDPQEMVTRTQLSTGQLRASLARGYGGGPTFRITCRSSAPTPSPDLCSTSYSSSSEANLADGNIVAAAMNWRQRQAYRNESPWCRAFTTPSAKPTAFDTISKSRTGRAPRSKSLHVKQSDAPALPRESLGFLALSGRAWGGAARSFLVSHASRAGQHKSGLRRIGPIE